MEVDKGPKTQGNKNFGQGNGLCRGHDRNNRLANITFWGLARDLARARIFYSSASLGLYRLPTTDFPTTNYSLLLENA